MLRFRGIRGAGDSTAGLCALADLVLQALGPQPALAYASTTNPDLTMRMTAEAGTIAIRAARARHRKTGSGEQPPVTAVEAGHQDSWRLVQAAQQGDGDAFGQLYDRYVDAVFRFIYFRVNDRALAEDFTSETFLRALRRINAFSYQGRDVGAWFITIARNIILDHVKSARHRLEVSTGATIEGPELAPSPETAVLDVLTSERLLGAVKKLNTEQRECIVLRFIQGYSVSETAQIMGKNDGAIKALQHRAVRKLADMVGSELR